MRTKVTFSPNIPTQVVLDSPGELQQSKNGADEYRYFLQGDQIMWVPPEVHQQIEHAGATQGDTFTIAKVKVGKAAATWTVEQHADEPGYGYGNPSPTTPPRLTSQPRPAPTPVTHERTAQGWIARQAAAPTPDARQEQPLTNTDKLSAALAAAIDAAAEASTYAHRKGVTLAWTASDIRAMAATLYIDAGKGAR